MHITVTGTHILSEELPSSFITDLDEIGFEMEDFDYEDPERFTKNIFTFDDGRIYEGYYGWVRYQEGILYYNGKPVYRYMQNGIEMIDGAPDETMKLLNKAFNNFCEPQE